jgi:transcription initiation factor IIF auxiliary subunit
MNASVSEYVKKSFTSSNSHNFVIILQGLSIFRPIIYGNTATVLTTKEREDLASPDHTHRWTVAVRSAASLPDSDEVGGADDLSYFIKRVTFKLHETYPNPSRSACLALLNSPSPKKKGKKKLTFSALLHPDIDKSPFEVTETGYVPPYHHS